MSLLLVKTQPLCPVLQQAASELVFQTRELLVLLFMVTGTCLMLPDLTMNISDVTLEVSDLESVLKS